MRVSLLGRDQDRTCRLGIRENQSRRGLTKVAQYEVLRDKSSPGNLKHLI